MAAEPTTTPCPPGTPRYCPRCEYDLAVTEPDRPCPECAWVQGSDELIFEIASRDLSSRGWGSVAARVVPVVINSAVGVFFLVQAVGDGRINARSDVFMLVMGGMFFGWALTEVGRLRPMRLSRPDRLLIAREGVGRSDPLIERRVGSLGMPPMIAFALVAYFIGVVALMQIQGVPIRVEDCVLFALATAGPLVPYVYLRVGPGGRPARDGMPGLSSWSRITQVAFDSRAENVYRLRIARGFWFSRFDCELTLDPLAFQTLVQSIRKNSAAPILLDGWPVAANASDSAQGATACATRLRSPHVPPGTPEGEACQ